MRYTDITDKIYDKAKPYKGKVEKQNFYEYEGKKYIVDGHNVVYNHDEREGEVAELLLQTFGGEVQILIIHRELKAQIIFITGKR